MSRTPSPWARTCSAISPSGVSGAGQHDPDVVLPHDVARAVADAGLEAREGDRREAPQRAEVGRRLAGVAHPELDVVDAVERQEVLGLGVGVLVDMGARLVGGGRARRGPCRSAWAAVSVIGALRLSRRPGGGAWPRARMDDCDHSGPAPSTGSSAHRVQDFGMTDQPPPIADPSSRLAASRTAFAALAPEGGRGRAVAARRGLRAPGPRPRGGRARSCPTRPRCSPTGSASSSGSSRRDGTRRWPAVRPARDRHAAVGVLERDRTLPLRELFDRIDT